MFMSVPLLAMGVVLNNQFLGALLLLERDPSLQSFN